MGASKSFIKNAVGILIVVAICFVAVTIYKKGNNSINDSLRDYDKLIAQFDNTKLKSYDNSTVLGSQIIELLKTLETDAGVSIEVWNGYSIKEKKAQTYTYNDIHKTDSTILSDITDKTKKEYFINPNASFSASVVYDDNAEVSSVIFKQE